MDADTLKAAILKLRADQIADIKSSVGLVADAVSSSQARLAGTEGRLKKHDKHFKWVIVGIIVDFVISAVALALTLK